jgi:ATP-dependent RNA helicase DDX52/ROK1
MEAFQLLSRGGSFNKSRFRSDVQLFNASTSFNVGNVSIEHVLQGTAAKVTPQAQSANNLPPSLDFFKYAKGTGQAKTGVVSTKTMAKEESDSDEGQRIGEKRSRRADHDDRVSLAPALRHRVTTKGQRVPAESKTFEDMEQRFKLPSHVMKNIMACGYSEPTAIQRVGIPILAEVTLHPYPCPSMNLTNLYLESRYCCHIAHWYWKDAHVPPTSFCATRGPRRKVEL